MRVGVGRARPRSVVVERFTSVAVDAGRVVTAVARLRRLGPRQARRRPDRVVPVGHAARRVTVTLAPTSNLQSLRIKL